jgi:hypothetical protein
MQELLCIFFLFWFYSWNANAQQLITYPVRQIAIYSMHNKDYTLMARNVEVGGINMINSANYRYEPMVKPASLNAATE